MNSRTRRTAWAVASLAICLALGAHAAPPALQSISQPAPSKTKSIPPPAERVDINRASVEELLKIPGMTPSWAGRIVRFRPYRTKRDLLDHGVLPSDVYDRIKDAIIAHRGEQ
jgi:DNA uptake protein ComE-like DNA-binding protein